MSDSQRYLKKVLLIYNEEDNTAVLSLNELRKSWDMNIFFIAFSTRSLQDNIERLKQKIIIF